MLYEETRHEPLESIEWDESIILNVIKKEFIDTVEAYDKDTLWPTHGDEDLQQKPNKCVYCGAAGVLSALWQISNKLDIETGFDFHAVASNIVEKYYENPDLGAVIPSFYQGESGVLYTAYLITKDNQYLTGLERSIKSNLGNPANELLNGDVSTMQVSYWLYQQTNDDKWRSMYLNSFKNMYEEWFEFEEGIWGWEQNLWGKTYRYLGAAHGIFGNFAALLEGIDLIEKDIREVVLNRIESTALHTAITENNLTNWPVVYNGNYCMMQWCHGAPGILTSLLEYKGKFNVELERLLAQAGDLVCQAGPLKKGASLCHGTMGNALGFTKLFEYTKDEIWLERAKSFSMHAVIQMVPRRYSLWTGKMGVLSALLPLLICR